MLPAALSVSAQEALQNMQAGVNAANSRSQQMQSVPDYTFKKGDFSLLLVPSMGLEYNDNVNLADTNALDDFIITPSLEITASYPLTQRNLLYLDFTVGYNWYLEHPRFSSFDLNSSSGTGLSFDFAIKDVTVNLHDWISYVQGAGQDSSTASTASAAVVNTASYGTFQNTAGLSGTWDLNQASVSAGYDHQNIIATSGQFDETTHSEELLFVRGGLEVRHKMTVGLEATAGLTSYEQNALNDNDAYTVGPYLEWTSSKVFSVMVRGGYSINEFQNTSTTIRTASQDSWYAGLTLTHQPTETVSYALAVGREVQLGIQSDLLEDWYVRPSVTWNIVKGFAITTDFFYEHGNQGVGSVGSLPGSSNGVFNHYGGGLTIQHAITSHLTAALNYQITFHSSDEAGDKYTQNMVRLQLSYQFK